MNQKWFVPFLLAIQYEIDAETGDILDFEKESVHN